MMFHQAKLSRQVRSNKSNRIEYSVPQPIPEEENQPTSSERAFGDDAVASISIQSDNIEPEIFTKFIRRACGILVNDKRTRIFISTCIVTNAIGMGAATYPFVRNNPETILNFERMDAVFLVIYTVEFLLQFIYRGFKLFSDGWLLFDFFIIFISWVFGSFGIIRSFRILRVLRLIGRLSALKQVVDALLMVVPKLIDISILLLLMFYVFAVMFTEFFGNMYRDGYTEYDYFSRLDITAFTLFQIMCLDDWGDIVREVTATYWYASILFMMFLLLSTFSILNLFIAVFCKAVHELEEMRLASKGIDDDEYNDYNNNNNNIDDNDNDNDLTTMDNDNCIIQSFLNAEQEIANDFHSLNTSQKLSIQRIKSISEHIIKKKNNSI